MEKQVWRIGKTGRCVVSDVIPTSRLYYTEGDYQIEKEYCGGYIIAESIPDEEITKLIAAAPEMLEVLIELRNWVCQLHDWSSGTSLYPTIDRVDAVIKKATE